MKSKKFNPGKSITIFFIFFASVFFALGIWQIERGQAKAKIIYEFENNLKKDASAFSENSKKWDKVFISGTWDNSRQILVDNVINRGIAGYKVLTPLKIDNSDIFILVDSYTSGPPVFSDVSFVILGDDPEVLKVLGEELELIISNAPDVSHTKSATSNLNTNIEFELNSSNISLSGRDANLLIGEMLAENNGIFVGTMLDSNKEIPIRLKGTANSKNLTGNAGYLTVPSKNGFEYLDSFGSSSLTSKASIITRMDGQRSNIVEGWVWTGTLPSATEEFIKKDVSEFESRLPIGYNLKQLGEAESRGESQAQIYSSALIYLVLIIIGLVLVLNSFRETGLILSVAILSVGLSFVGLFVGQQNYGFIATISAVGLIGLSINDSIIVLSHIKEEAAKKLITKSELVEVVIRSTRHIITTSLTTLGGFLPLIFASVFFKPLAWAMSIGVLGATITALLYIPAMFIVLRKIKH